MEISEMESSRSLGHELIRSKQRISDHGEVFTTSWMVQDMLDLVKDESERIDSRFLEPACGSGNFLMAVLNRKLLTVDSKYGKSEFEKRQHALFSLMCIYGIELLRDNVEECRDNLLEIFSNYLELKSEDVLYRAAKEVLKVNIVQGDALTLTRVDDSHIEFRFDSLTQRASTHGTLFELFEEHQLFVPTKTHTPMSAEEIAQ
jgi:type I restriction-modification system DNA methylase subunit